MTHKEYVIQEKVGGKFRDVTTFSTENCNRWEEPFEQWLPHISKDELDEWRKLYKRMDPKSKLRLILRTSVTTEDVLVDEDGKVPDGEPPLWL